MPAKFASLSMLSFAQDSSLTLVDSVRHTPTNWESSLCMSGKDRTFKVMVRNPEETRRFDDRYLLLTLNPFTECTMCNSPVDTVMSRSTRETVRRLDPRWSLLLLLTYCGI